MQNIFSRVRTSASWEFTGAGITCKAGVQESGSYRLLYFKFIFKSLIITTSSQLGGVSQGAPCNFGDLTEIWRNRAGYPNRRLNSWKKKKRRIVAFQCSSCKEEVKEDDKAMQCDLCEYARCQVHADKLNWPYIF